MLQYNPAQFPWLAIEGHVETSRACKRYNCIAWAAGDTTKFWWPVGPDDYGKEAYWPRKAKRKVNLKAFVGAFEKEKYEKCSDGILEPGYEKIAIYVFNGKPTHAARQLADGKWTHKFGRNIDFTASLRSVEGPTYGSVAQFMRRKLPAPKPPSPKTKP